MNQPYSEVVCEVMGLICRNQMTGANPVNELLVQAVGLTPHQRTVESMLRMPADRTGRTLPSRSWAARTAC